MEIEKINFKRLLLLKSLFKTLQSSAKIYLIFSVTLANTGANYHFLEQFYQVGHAKVQKQKNL
jgi:hypothetical protein